MKLLCAKFVMMNAISGMRILRSTLRCWCSQSRSLTVERTNYVSVTIDPEFNGSVAVVKLQKKPANSLCIHHLREISKTFTDLENNETVRAMILTSGSPGLFCAGIDLMTLYGATVEEIYTFWGVLYDTVFKIFNSPLTVIAALNGHCIAGGCSLAFSTDYRILAEGSKIGLNEVKLGLPIPYHLSQMTQNLVGFRQSDILQQLGTLIQAPEALRIGLVDETVPVDEVLPTAKKQIAKWLEVPDTARAMIKDNMRKEQFNEFKKHTEAECQLYARLISDQPVQAILKKHIEGLKKK